MNKEAVQMLATPAECILKDFVEFGDTGCADHEQPPPHQRTHAAERYAKLMDRNGRYRRFRHANSLSKRQPRVLNLMPPESPALLHGVTWTSAERPVKKTGNSGIREFST
jgi:hypothetical protein